MTLRPMRFGVPGFVVSELRDRFAVYHAPLTQRERFELLGPIEGLEGVELIYPTDLHDPDEIKGLLAEHGLACSAVNVNLKLETKFHSGSFTSTDPGVRREAIEYGRRGVELAVQLGANLVTICPIADGHDYPFEADYRVLWRNMVEWLEAVAAVNAAVRIAIEYKPSEPRVHVLIPNAGTALHLCHQVGLSNVGVNLDIGHSLYAGETPAQIVSMLADAERLFLVHINDNYRNFDWDLIPGTVNYWDWLETLLYLDAVGYSGWLDADIFPFRTDPVKTIEATYAAIQSARGFIERIGVETMWGLIKQRDPALTLRTLHEAVGGGHLANGKAHGA